MILKNTQLIQRVSECSAQCFTGKADYKTSHCPNKTLSCRHIRRGKRIQVNAIAIAYTGLEWKRTNYVGLSVRSKTTTTTTTTMKELSLLRLDAVYDFFFNWNSNWLTHMMSQLVFCFWPNGKNPFFFVFSIECFSYFVPIEAMRNVTLKHNTNRKESEKEIWKKLLKKC